MQRTVLESHLKRAQAALDDHVKVLTGRKLDEKQRKRDAIYRKYQAVVRKYSLRLKALDKYEAIEADVAQRRAERLAKPKEPKVKKKKAVVEAKPKEAKQRREKKPEGDAK